MNTRFTPIVLATVFSISPLLAQNRDRQAQTRDMQEKATAMAQEMAAGEILFAFSSEFNSGIVGLAAARGV